MTSKKYINEALQQELKEQAQTVIKLEVTVNNLITAVKELSDNVKDINRKQSEIGKTDWKTIIAAGALVLTGMWYTLQTSKEAVVLNQMPLLARIERLEKLETKLDSLLLLRK